MVLVTYVSLFMATTAFNALYFAYTCLTLPKADDALLSIAFGKEQNLLSKGPSTPYPGQHFVFRYTKLSAPVGFCRCTLQIKYRIAQRNKNP